MPLRHGKESNLRRFLKQFLNNANISAAQIPKNEKLWAQIRNIRGFEMF